MWNLTADILPIHDVERTYEEYDPVTGKKIRFGDSLLSCALIVLPEIKGIKLLAKSEKATKLVKGVKNVLHPDLIKNAF
ncbi:pre-toxin TG domain-containing protein [Scopulibacillus cellulosilyticus]|uniref:Pre-toxin TG domain-containing protein n=1 Tax=Scopulibacillus cellulosilyticus TaxID=2665665 RepID=A0ABW2PZA2_9BACL